MEKGYPLYPATQPALHLCLRVTGKPRYLSKVYFVPGTCPWHFLWLLPETEDVIVIDVGPYVWRVLALDSREVFPETQRMQPLTVLGLR